MEKTVNDYSISLFLWQIFVFVLLIAIIYFLVKLYKKYTENLNNKPR